MTLLDHLPPGAELPVLSDARRRIFEGAIELFGDKGFHGVTVRDIAEHLGIKAPSLYAHVTSKQDLLFQLVLLGEAFHRDAMREALLASQPEPLDQVRSLVRAHVLVHLQQPELARLINNEIRHLAPEQVAQVMAIRAESAQLMRDVLNRGTRMGVFRAASPRVLRAIGDMGVRTAEWDDRPDPSELDEIADEYASYAITLITHSPPAP